VTTTRRSDSQGKPEPSYAGEGLRWIDARWSALGNVAAQRCYERAEDLYSTLAVRKQMGDINGIAYCLFNLGDIFWARMISQRRGMKLDRAWHCSRWRPPRHRLRAAQPRPCDPCREGMISRLRFSTAGALRSDQELRRTNRASSAVRGEYTDRGHERAMYGFSLLLQANIRISTHPCDLLARPYAVGNCGHHVPAWATKVFSRSWKPACRLWRWQGVAVR